jgi:hypothetical protein
MKGTEHNQPIITPFNLLIKSVPRVDNKKTHGANTT